MIIKKLEENNKKGKSHKPIHREEELTWKNLLQKAETFIFVEKVWKKHQKF